MRSCVVMILLILVGCGGVLKGDRGVAWDGFMTKEERAFGRLLGEGSGENENAFMVGDVNSDFMTWMTQGSSDRNKSSGDNRSLFLDGVVAENDTLSANAGRLLGTLPMDRAWQQEGVKVGVLLPMSGPLSVLGKYLWQSSLMVLHRYSERDDVSLFLYDTKGNKQGARAAFGQAIAEQVDIVIGPFLSSNLEEIRRMKKENVGMGNLPILSFSNNNAQAGEGIYIFGYTPEQQLTVLLDYTFLQGKEKLGVLLPQTLYGKEVNRSLDDILLQRQNVTERLLIYDMSVENIGLMLHNFSGYNKRRALRQRALNLAKAEEQEDEIERIGKRDTLGEPPFDSLLLVAGDAADLRTLSSQLSFLDIDRRNGVQFLGLQGWENFEGLNREPSLVGAWYVAPPEGERKTFEDHYAQIYGEKPVRLATLAFEMVLLVSTIATEIKGGANLQQLLEQPSGFIGIEGSYRFLPSGKVERLMDIMRITSKGAVTEAEAFSSFNLWDNQQRQQREQRERESSLQ